MSELIKTVENLIKDGDMYTYEEIHTRSVRVSVEALNKKKTALEVEIAIIDYLLVEIAKLG